MLIALNGFTTVGTDPDGKIWYNDKHSTFYDFHFYDRSVWIRISNHNEELYRLLEDRLSYNKPITDIMLDWTNDTLSFVLERAANCDSSSVEYTVANKECYLANPKFGIF